MVRESESEREGETGRGRHERDADRERKSLIISIFITDCTQYYACRIGWLTLPTRDL